VVVIVCLFDRIYDQRDSLTSIYEEKANITPNSKTKTAGRLMKAAQTRPAPAASRERRRVIISLLVAFMVYV